MFKKSHTQRSDRKWEKTKEIDMEMDHYRSRHSGERRRRVRSDYDDYPQSRDSQSHREMIDNEKGSSTSKEKGRVKGQDRDHEQWERSKEHDREVYQERHHTRKRLRGDDDYSDPCFERFGDKSWERKRDREVDHRRNRLRGDYDYSDPCFERFDDREVDHRRKRLRGDYHYRGSRNPDFDRRRDYERKPLLHMIQASETLDAAAPVTDSKSTAGERFMMMLWDGKQRQEGLLGANMNEHCETRFTSSGVCS